MNRLEPIMAAIDSLEPAGQVLTKEELACRWKISISTVKRLASDRVHGVRSLKIRRRLRFRLCDIEEFERRNLARQRAF